MENTQELRQELQITLDNKNINLLRIINCNDGIVWDIWRSENNLFGGPYWDIVNSAEITFILSQN